MARQGRRGRGDEAAAQAGDAVDLAKLHGPEAVERALAEAANAHRFADGDLEAILAHQAQGKVIPFPARTSDEQTLRRSTEAWEGFGR